MISAMASSLLLLLQLSGVDGLPSFLRGGTEPTPFGDGDLPLRDMFVFAGQSNCVGCAKLEDIPRSLELFAAQPSHVFAWPKDKGQEWSEYEAQGTNKFNLPGAFGPELSFINEISPIYQKANESFGVIKVAKIGTSLKKDWVLTNYQSLLRNKSRLQHFREEFAAADMEVLEQIGRGNMGHLLDLEANAGTSEEPFLFAMLVDSVRNAMNSPQCDGGKCRVKALIWVQGEADAGLQEEDGKEYEQLLNNLVSTLREVLDSPDMFVIIAQLAPDLIDTATHPSGELVLKAQDDWTAKQGNRAALVPTKGITKQADDLHYDAAGYIELGRRSARAYLEHVRHP